MRILFVGDASNFHNTLAGALRELGHEAVVVSDGSTWMDTPRDINLTRRPGKAGAVAYVASLARALPKMRGFDVVHIVNPVFLKLRPWKVRRVFDYLRRNNRLLFLSALGTDYEYVRACTASGLFRYSDYRIGDQPSPYMLSDESVGQDAWLRPSMHRHNDYIVNGVDGIVACMYEYYATYQAVAPHKLCHAGVPIDTRAIEPVEMLQAPEKVRFFIGIQRKRDVLKGTDRLLAAARRVRDRMPGQCDITVVENLPYREYLRSLRGSHVILEQLYSYTPATTALTAMATGLVAVSGAEPEYYDLIGERDNRPIINALPYDDSQIDQALQRIVERRGDLPRLSRMSREFVVKHNDSLTVARRHIDFWNKISTIKTGKEL